LKQNPSPLRFLARLLATAAFAQIFAPGSSAAEPATPPALGAAAPNFALKTLDDKTIELKTLAEQQPVVLLVLRGWPGYQCPLCTRQVHDFVARAAEFKARGAQVLMVYPGPGEQLKAHAREFIADKSWPAEFIFVIDPDYIFTNAYGLRWDAPRETAYPSTFVIERGGRVRFAQISKSHGGRAGAASALSALP